MMAKIQIVLLLVTLGCVSGRSVSKKELALNVNKFKGNSLHNEVEVDLKNGLKTDMRFEKDADKDKRGSYRINQWTQTSLVSGKLTIPYVIDGALTPTVQNVIKNAISTLNGYLLCHDNPIVPRDSSNTNLHYLKFVFEGGCWSYVGMTSGSFQKISIGDGCGYKGTVMHEVLHALGFFHEQSRPDRDEYVTIKLENVLAGFENNFKKSTYTHDNYKKFPYDYQSVMHYGETYFTKNGEKTIVPKNSTAQIGQRTDLSATDKAELNAYFNCDTSGNSFTTPTTTTRRTTTTKQPTVNGIVELANTRFRQRYPGNGISYGDWISQGCIDQYSNCADFSSYCSTNTNLRLTDCAHTCGCPSGSDSYLQMPSGKNSPSWLVSAPNFSVRVERNTLTTKNACNACTGSNCPKYPFCARVIYRRLPGSYTSGSKSRISFMAYNVADNYYLTGRPIGPFFIGSENEDSSYYFSTQNLQLSCENMHVYVNGTKGNDEIQLHKFELYSGSCNQIPYVTLSKREVEDFIEFKTNDEDKLDEELEDWKSIKVPEQHGDGEKHKLSASQFVHKNDPKDGEIVNTIKEVDEINQEEW